MIEKIRLFLYCAIAIVLFLLYQSWQENHHNIKPSSVVSQHRNTVAVEQGTEVPVAGQDALPHADVPALKGSQGKVPMAFAAKTPTKQLIHVKTDTVNVDIDPVGGALVGLDLMKFSNSLEDKLGKVRLFDESEDSIYTAQSGLQGPVGPDTVQGPARYTAESSSYELQPGDKQLDVVLTHHFADGIQVKKTYVFKPGSYVIHVKHQIINNTPQAWHGRFYSLLKRSRVDKKSGFFTFPTYTGAAISSPEKRFEKMSFDAMNKNNLDRTVQGGWIAMVQHYFVSAWIPNEQQDFHFYSSAQDNQLFRVGMIGPWLTVPAGEQKTVSARLYAGPEHTALLKQVAPGLELTVDYGWFWPISQGLFWVMKLIYELVGNWGIAIILVTVLIKIAFFWLSASSYRSMANMRRLQPKIVALKERFGEDRQKMSQAMMEMYKKEKINPLGGCIPILIQIPVFIALYWVLIESVELRQAPFYFWIHDLSVKDPYHILPLIMGATMFLQQRLSPAPPDPMQAKVMMAMPVVFTMLFLSFPAGLMLYWVVNNSLSIAQQWFITRQIEGNAKKS